MAEILLSLTIIGVVAAITLPSLTGNINERTWNTQRKALFSRMTQAISLMPSLNGYGTLVEDDANNVTENFVTGGLAKVLKINNVCDSEHLTDCGIASTIVNMANEKVPVAKSLVELNGLFNGSYVAPTWYGASNPRNFTYEMIDTKAAAFETANGESILTYYNPNCVGDLNETQEFQIQPKMCVNFVFDLNGSKGPNTIGKDVGVMTVSYPSDSIVVLPQPLWRKVGNQMPFVEAGRYCKDNYDDARIPNREELMSVFVNSALLDGAGASLTGSKWTSSIVKSDPTNRWSVELFAGLVYVGTTNRFVVCVER